MIISGYSQCYLESCKSTIAFGTESDPGAMLMIMFAYTSLNSFFINFEGSPWQLVWRTSPIGARLFVVQQLSFEHVDQSNFFMLVCLSTPAFANNGLISMTLHNIYVDIMLSTLYEATFLDILQVDKTSIVNSKNLEKQ